MDKLEINKHEALLLLNGINDKLTWLHNRLERLENSAGDPGEIEWTKTNLKSNIAVANKLRDYLQQ